MTVACRRRVDVPGESLAFTAPPHRLDLLFLRRAGPFALLVHSPMGRLLEVERWLAAHEPTHMHSAGGLDPHVLRAEFDVVPAPWEALLAGATTRSLHLSTAGMATVFFDPGEDSPFLAQATQTRDADAPAPPARTRPHAERLTDRQIDALSLAVSLGYYAVPHRVSQREIASRLGMSLSALSRLLRRAEAALVATHMDAVVDAGADLDRFRPLLEPHEAVRARTPLRVPLAPSVR